MATYPMTARVTQLNKRGKTYQQMAADSEFKRSVTWWNHMYWVEIENPPEPKLYPYLAKALEVTERRVAEMVAEQWCGVKPDDEVPDHLRDLVTLLKTFDPADVAPIESMAQVLARHIEDVERREEAPAPGKTIRIKRSPAKTS
ncbi:hypothetical protein [Streptomyces sp. Midd1]|uniref:hypothetical protein n=1 Tax=Streptomyces sp. Midd3 TaxID=3161191 RepID=UPI0034DB7587